MQKNTKKTFPSSESKEKGILEIIDFDVCGSMSSNSLSVYVYYVFFIDDFCRKAWIYFLKNKDEVFRKFKEFKALIKNHTEKKIKTFRSDNDGEFTSNEFKELCKVIGITPDSILFMANAYIYILYVTVVFHLPPSLFGFLHNCSDLFIYNI